MTTEGPVRTRLRPRRWTGVPFALFATLLVIAASCSQGSGSSDEQTQDPSASTTAPASEGETTDETIGSIAADEEPAAAQDAESAEPIPEIGNEFFEDFVSDTSMARFDFDVYHRDDSLVRVVEWPADHVSTGPNDLCGPPSESRTIVRGERDEGFNDDWIYRCVPGGDLEKAHVMTSIGHTSGYSIGAFTPKQAFQDIQEIRWDVNQTDLGARQWTEVTLIPVDTFDFENLPCLDGLPCSTVLHSDIGSVGTHWGGTRVRIIGTPDQAGGYNQSAGERGYRCQGCSREPSMRFGEAYGVDDPALTSVVIRRKNFFRDNGDGTLTWGYELEGGEFQEFTAPGSFPEGPVRVVFKDHNYTPLKSPSLLLPETTFTWHWDNIEILPKETVS